MAYPSYLNLFTDGELTRRAEALGRLMEHCSLCPRACGINRLKDLHGQCGYGRLPALCTHQIDFTEEPPLSGTRGTGRIFFGYPQAVRSAAHPTRETAGHEPMDVSVKKLANILLYLQEEQCHHIEFHSPGFHIPMIVEALNLAVCDGLRTPLVWVSDAYESLPTLQLVDGIFDLYVPRILFHEDHVALSVSSMDNYRAVSRAAVREMHAQVGNLVVENGVARQGLIVRHLVLPGGLSGTREVLTWIATDISRECFLSVQGYFVPAMELRHPRVLSREISVEEYEEAVLSMRDLGLMNGWLQQASREPGPEDAFSEEPGDTGGGNGDS